MIAPANVNRTVPINAAAAVLDYSFLQVPGTLLVLIFLFLKQTHAANKLAGV